MKESDNIRKDNSHNNDNRLKHIDKKNNIDSSRCEYDKEEVIDTIIDDEDRYQYHLGQQIALQEVLCHNDLLSGMIYLSTKIYTTYSI